MKISDNNDIAFEKFPVQQSDYERREGQVMDWNHDGKHDWEDDTLFHAVIDNDDSEKESFFSSNRNTSRDRKSSWLSTVIPMIYLGLFLPGNIPINGVTMLLGLICVGILISKMI